MIFGQAEFPDKSFLIHLDVLEKQERFLYGAFNFIIQEKWYPAYGTGWTINLIVEYMSSLLHIDESEFYYQDSDELGGEALFQEAVISRLGYFYNNPDSVMEIDDFKRKYPSKIGVELELAELADSNLDVYIFKGKYSEYLVFHYEGFITKIKINIAGLKK